MSAQERGTPHLQYVYDTTIPELEGLVVSIISNVPVI